MPSYTDRSPRPDEKDGEIYNFITTEEFEKKINQVVYVSATPGDYELELTGGKYTEQIIRPTGLLDPTIEVRPTLG